MSYKIQFLNDEEFESLPGKDMYSKVGVAYPEIGQAFVRKSGAKVVDVFSAMHELEHLEGNSLDEHFDQENRCYYKSMGDWLGPIGTIAGSIFGGPAGGSIGGMLGGAGGSLFGGGKSSGMANVYQQAAHSQNPVMSGGMQQAGPNVFQTGGASAGGAGGGNTTSQNGGLRGPVSEELMKQFNSGYMSGRQPFGG